MRWRLRELNKRHGGRVLVAISATAARRQTGKWLVDTRCLAIALRADGDAEAARVEELAARIDTVEERQLAARNSYRRLRRDISHRFANQEAWNEKHAAWRKKADLALNALREVTEASRDLDELGQ
jgi:vacuolar-type H+-ATPase subunit I/STV1